MLGGMGAAANAAQNSTSEFNLTLVGTSATTNGFQCQLFFVVPFHISMGIFLISFGLLLCTQIVMIAVSDSLTKIHKCLHYTFAFVLLVSFIVVFASLSVSLFAASSLFIVVAFYEVFPITNADNCNHVLYYWAFVYVVIVLAVIGVAIMLFIVSVIMLVFFYLLEKTGRE